MQPAFDGQNGRHILENVTWVVMRQQADGNKEWRRVECVAGHLD